MFKKIFRNLFICTALIAIAAFPKMALAQEAAGGLQNEQISTQAPLGTILRAPMPYSRTLTDYYTARSLPGTGFAYIYVSANVTIDGQYNRIMSVNKVTTYQADGSFNFDRWEQTSLTYKKYSNYVWVKATGYVYFKGFLGFADKQYIEINRNLYIQEAFMHGLGDSLFVGTIVFVQYLVIFLLIALLILACIALIKYIWGTKDKGK